MLKKSKLKLEFVSYNPKILVFITNFLYKEIDNKNIIGPIFLPIKKKNFCILRSPFVDKDSRDQFEIRMYSAFFICKFKYLTNILKFVKLLFKKFSFDFSNNIYIKIKKI